MMSDCLRALAGEGGPLFRNARAELGDALPKPVGLSTLGSVGEEPEPVSLLRTLTRMLVRFGRSVVGAAARGPKPLSEVPYSLHGILTSGSGAHESTGRWSEGSISRPSTPLIGSEGSRLDPRLVLERPAGPWLCDSSGEDGTWKGFCGFVLASSGDDRTVGLCTSNESGENGIALPPGELGIGTDLRAGVDRCAGGARADGLYGEPLFDAGYCNTPGVTCGEW